MLSSWSRCLAVVLSIAAAACALADEGAAGPSGAPSVAGKQESAGLPATTNQPTAPPACCQSEVCATQTGIAAAGASPVPPQYDAGYVRMLLDAAKTAGDAHRGALVFARANLACVSCHKLGAVGGTVGPELTRVAVDATEHDIAASILWPKWQVKKGFAVTLAATADGEILQGYIESETDQTLVLRDPANGAIRSVPKADIDARTDGGTLMPEGLAQAMTLDQRLDVLSFLLALRGDQTARFEQLVRNAHAPVMFAYDRAPLWPERYPHWQHPVNRDRVYDFYAKEAAHFVAMSDRPAMLAAFPGLDGGMQGHWGNQNDDVWADDRWNATELGSVQMGGLRGPRIDVAKGVSLRLGEHGELNACFNPQTLTYDALWTDGFVSFSAKRHGFLDALTLEGRVLPLREQATPSEAFVYHGFYRHGPRVVFSYRVGDIEMLDAPWVKDGKFVREVGPAATHPLRHLIEGGKPQWPQTFATRGTLGQTQPYTVDTIRPPLDNPWRALMFFGGHDFLSDGTAIVCTIQGDVWRVEGLDDTLEHVTWRRIASGLNQALGLVVHDDRIYVLGRDQVTRLVDLNGDHEADFYECVSNVYPTSTAGHDFTCGLERDAEGNFYTASFAGLLKIAADGRSFDVLATGFRNPDGIGLLRDGSLTVPCSEGEWTPSSMVCLVRPQDMAASKPPHFGYKGPIDGQAPSLPLVYMPRALDNSSGGQVVVDSDRWGPLDGQLLHFSFGAGDYYLVLRDEIDGQPQGAVVPMRGEFLSGAHRGRFNPRDGQLYITGMAGWGSYTPDDGCFHRVRYTGDRAQLPIAFRVHQNGVRVTFAEPLDPSLAEDAARHLAQAWNYRYSGGYGSPEFSPSHRGTVAHDLMPIASAHVLSDGRSLFLEIPSIRPVNQLHLYMKVDGDAPQEMFVTVHRLAKPFSDFRGYQPIEKTIAAHPMLVDLATAAKTVRNPHSRRLPGARPLVIEAGRNLTYATKVLRASPGEPLALTFKNPDVVPHNLAVLKPGMLAKVGDLANRLVADPDAAARHYIPQTNDVLCYTDVVAPNESETIYFHAPEQPGRYPYLCTFPGHWMVMNGELVVE